MSISDLDLELRDGIWTRSQLEAMDAAFVAVCERAFAEGTESRAAAAATVRLGRNGSRRLAEDAAIGAAWDFLWSKQGDMTALEVMERVRAVCPYVTAEKVREEFKRRLCGSNGLVTGLNDGPEKRDGQIGRED